METKVYVKVIIKTEADLPKINSEYYAYSKSDSKILLQWWDSQGRYGINTWLANVKWYLLPVYLPTDEDLKKKASEFADKNGKGDYGTYYGCFLIAAKWLRDKLLNPLK